MFSEVLDEDGSTISLRNDNVDKNQDKITGGRTNNAKRIMPKEEREDGVKMQHLNQQL